jgi:hypothetical protein
VTFGSSRAARKKREVMDECENSNAPAAGAAGEVRGRHLAVRDAALFANARRPGPKSRYNVFVIADGPARRGAARA